MDNNNGKYYIDWWLIKRSTVYTVIAIIAFLALFASGIWWLWQNDWVITPPEDQNAPKDSARIISFEGNVRVIRVNTQTSETVTKSTYVQAGDTVQTQSDGRAKIRMIDGSTLSVRPNSTVVISDSSSILGGKNVRVKLDDGQINVRTEEQEKSSNNVVEMQESENRLQSQTEASFNMDSKTKGGEIRINRGGVESNIGGEKTVLKEKEYVKIDDKKITSREKLLAVPNLETPSPSKQMFSASGKANISFVWEKSEEYPNSKYSLQVAKSPFFVSGKMIVEETSLSNTEFRLRNLSTGTYFWRVRASIASGQVSEWSSPSKFSVVRQKRNSNIEVNDWSVESVGGRIYIIRGKTVPGATVNSSGRETFAKSDGSFSLQISSSSSSKRVEVYDQDGNRSSFIISLRTGKVIR